jgi:hypothetical protein
MANSTEDEKQVSVRLDPALHATIARVACEEHRTVSGQIRHLVAKALQGQHEGIAA